MNTTEQQALAKRQADLLAELNALPDADLQKRAAAEGVDTSKLKTRENVVEAIEIKISDDEGKARLEAMQRAEDELARSDKESGTDRVARTIRTLNAAFCADIPQSGRGGSFSPDDDPGGKFDGGYDVPDGKYRVTGSDWVFSIKKKKLDEAVLATPENKYGGKGVIAVE